MFVTQERISLLTLTAQLLTNRRDGVLTALASWVRQGRRISTVRTLVSDADETLCRAFGVIQMKKLYGREYEGIVRSTFLIDPAGVIRRKWQRVKVPGHAQAVLDALKAEQAK